MSWKLVTRETFQIEFEISPSRYFFSFLFFFIVNINNNSTRLRSFVGEAWKKSKMEGGIIELRFFVKRYERVSTLLNRVDKNHFGFVIWV